MASTNHPGPYLIVEGPTDQRFLELRVDTAVYFVQAGGKSTCIALVKSLNKEARSFHYLAIVDEDYQWLNPDAETNLVLTDTRDIESMLIRSRALDAVLVEFGDRTKISFFERASGCSVRDSLLQRAVFFGRLRTIGYTKAIASLDALKPSRFAIAGWLYDHEACSQFCVDSGIADSLESLALEITQVEAPSDWHLARGHDLVDILHGGLIHALSDRKCQRPALESLLRQSMQLEEFKETGLYSRVAEWENANACKIWRRN